MLQVFSGGPLQFCWRESPMSHGKVKWFNDSKGYGFIEQEQGEDVFVHYSVIEMDGFRTLAEGTDVQFEAVQGEKGLQATVVKAG
jgi:cold shock protein